MNTVEIYYSDLIPTTQARVLAANNITDPQEANWDILPLTVLEYEPKGVTYDLP